MLLGWVGPVWVACRLVACAPHAVIGCDQLAGPACAPRHASCSSLQPGQEKLEGRGGRGGAVKRRRSQLQPPSALNMHKTVSAVTPPSGVRLSWAWYRWIAHGV